MSSPHLASHRRGHNGPGGVAGAPPGRPAPPRRPATVLVLLLSGLLAVAAAVGGLLSIAANGEAWARADIGDALGTELPAEGELDALTALLVDERESELAALGAFLILVAVPLLVCVLLSLKAATWARVLVTLTASGTLLAFLAVTAGDTRGALVAAGAFGALATVATLIACWLPATNRYAREVGAARRARR
ncbi:hypothetical protein [Streptomyces radicis]|uniref:Uncharacterized protein n=1 Tax=Streptomyces radicis TaxID=1750517 RepID=A0A3A9W7I2_9ACTN|nr:hypothetical protein [Streptomyces radicis]RKN08682.1 hypothetical protein D7319_14925 [Streptomyces radicis]RKN21840.1 hypothetical protein D7318_15880 [Streptomyces radicis]